MLGLLWMQRLVEYIGATWGIDSYMGWKDFQSNITGKFVQVVKWKPTTQEKTYVIQ